MSALAQADVLSPAPVRIVDVRRETADTCTVSTESSDGVQLPKFLPGQFSMLYAYGVGEAPISISGDPGIPDRLV